jgi:type I restriction enzyme S subunit
MTENWQDCVVADIASPVKNALVGGPFGSNLVTNDYVKSGIPVIRGQNMGERWVTGDFVFVSEAKAKQLSPNTARPGDLIFTQRGTLGQVSIVPANFFSSYIISQSQMKLTVDTEKSNSLFLYYFFKSPEQQDYISRNTIQTGVPHTNLGHLRTTPILLPSLSEQRAIAGILGTLDDKIEVNRRMNATLESMARAVFREMMKNEDGKWNTGSILEFANLLSGGTPSTSEASFWNGNIEWASAKDVGNVDGIFLLDTEKKITQKGVDNSSTKLLPEKTTIVTARGTVGAHCMLGKAMTMNQTNYGLKAKEGIGDYFVYFTLSEMVEQLKQQSYGTIFDTITTKTFQSAQCVQPPQEVIRKFESQVTPLMNMILNNQEESRTLGGLRDSLLPKLMMGEVRVKEVEETK